MLKRIKNRHAQAVMGEYVVTVFMVVLMAVAMTVYFKRAIQGRIRGARNYMVNEVRNRTAGTYSGNLLLFYEPYYVNRNSIVSRRQEDTRLLLDGASSGVFQKVFNQTTRVTTDSETFPPKSFGATLP